MSQNNKKIIEALKEWKEPIEGFGWDDDAKDSVRIELTTYFQCSTYRYETTLQAEYKNFSLTNPNEKKKISNMCEVFDWARANPKYIVRVMDVYYRADNLVFYNERMIDYYVQTAFNEWTPITEIEVVK